MYRSQGSMLLSCLVFLAGRVLLRSHLLFLVDVTSYVDRCFSFVCQDGAASKGFVFRKIPVNQLLQKMFSDLSHVLSRQGKDISF